MKKSQLTYVKEQLEKKGEITRNHCLKRMITRLSAIIFDLKDKGMKIEGEWKTTKKGRDYVYKLIK